MNDSSHVALIDHLRGLPAETEWLEFKRSFHEPEQLGQYLSALANSACLSSQSGGYLVFGINDESHEVIGTDFDPYTTKAKGNQDLLPWLGAGLQPNTGFAVHLSDHPDGRVVLFEVGPARDQPVSFHRKAYVRVGASKTELSRHPEFLNKDARCDRAAVAGAAGIVGSARADGRQDLLGAQGRPQS